MSLNEKINQYFAGSVVRKDLVKTVKGNAIVPSYVLEYLLGQYCATNDEDTIKAGIENVKEILKNHYVHRNEAGLVRSIIKEKGRHKVIDKISVELNQKNDSYEASFANLGISKVLVDSQTIKQHPKMLVSGVWCIASIEYDFTDDKNSTPWIMTSIKPIQLSSFDVEQFLTARKEFSKEEWIDLLIQSVGFEPSRFSNRNKLLQLIRLIPYCERNYNLIELGPKGTGKSHIYTEFSPHGILISGGEVTVPKLFVNNSSGKLGLVGYWDCVAFDEFAGKQKKIDKALVDIMKNYMANKSFSRGVETLGAEASMVFVGNTEHNVPFMLKHSDLFEALPEKFHDSAFLDRIHFYIPGWEIDIIRGEMFTAGYGFVVDYIAEVLKHLRNEDYSNRYKEFFELSSEISTRDRDGINKTFSGLMKIIYPSGEATKQEIEEILSFAIEGRKRVKDQLLRIDTTYADTKFGYSEVGKDFKDIKTLEEIEYPRYYHHDMEHIADSEQNILASNSDQNIFNALAPASKTETLIRDKTHLQIFENQKGISYDLLFGKQLQNAKNIVLTDPYLRIFFQLRNLMEFVECVAKFKSPDDETLLHVITAKEDRNLDGKQDISLEQIANSASNAGIIFTWEYDDTNTLHARHIVVDNNVKIILDRGLDIFQAYEMNDAFSLANRLQAYRGCKAFEVTYVKCK